MDGKLNEMQVEFMLTWLPWVPKNEILAGDALRALAAEETRAR